MGGRVLSSESTSVSIAEGFSIILTVEQHVDDDTTQPLEDLGIMNNSETFQDVRPSRS